MAEMKTIQNDRNVEEFLNKVPDMKKRRECYIILDLMRQATGEEPKMWGDAIIGFGSYHYKYDSGREGNMPLTGFSPRKQNLTLYIVSGFEEHKALMEKLGKYKTGKSCLYIHTLEDVDLTVLQELITRSVSGLH